MPEERQVTSATQQESILKWLKEENLLERCEFGEIYRMRDESSGKERALMRMWTQNMVTPEVERLKDGLTSLKPLNHERLLRSFSFIQEGQFLYIIRELFLGKTLHQRLRDGVPFDERKAAHFTYQILDGISYMHEKNLIHGSIRSKNILLIDGNNIKINCSVPGKKEMFALRSSSISEPLNYFTPEQAHKQEETKAVDIWGVGCTVIEMITRVRPWDRAEINTIVSSLKAFKGPPLPENITSKLKDFFEKTFAKPKDRQTSEFLLSHNWLTSPQGLELDSPALMEIGTANSRVEEEMQVGLAPGCPNPIGPDEFQQKDCLGHGSYGHVYAMTHKSGKCYAVKRLNDQMETDYKNREDRKSIVLREVKLSIKLRHQNLVAYYGYYYQKTEKKELCLVMELMKESLRTKVARDKGLDEPTTKKYTRQILAGLQHLNELEMVHRDIKASNILLSDADEAKIADYGFLKEISGERNAEIDLSKPDPPGPLLWRSPELQKKEKYTRNTDIWSLGCTVVEMMTTNPPVLDTMDYLEIIKNNGQGMPILPGLDVTQGLKDFLKMIFVPKEGRPYAFQLSGNTWLIDH